MQGIECAAVARYRKRSIMQSRQGRDKIGAPEGLTVLEKMANFLLIDRLQIGEDYFFLIAD
jgi:hypothetical protein